MKLFRYYKKALSGGMGVLSPSNLKLLPDNLLVPSQQGQGFYLIYNKLKSFAGKAA